MLKKDLYINVFVVTAAILIGAVAYYVFVLQKQIVDSFNQDPRVVQISATQSTLAQQIVKNALGMGYSRNEGQFNFFKGELGRTFPEWQAGHQALLNGSTELGIDKPIETDEYLDLLEGIRTLQIGINSSTSSLLETPFSQNQVDSDVNYAALRRIIAQLVNGVRDY